MTNSNLLQIFSIKVPENCTFFILGLYKILENRKDSFTETENEMFTKFSEIKKEMLKID